MMIRYYAKQELAPTIWEYSFSSERAVSFKPGQYARFVIPGAQADPRGSSRVFTLTSRPGDTTVSFIVKILEPASEYKRRLSSLVPDQEIQMLQPLGTFILPKQPPGQILCVTRGIGIASFESIFKQLASHPGNMNVGLLYSVRHKSEDISSRASTHLPSLRIVRTFYDPQSLSLRDIMDVYQPGTMIYISGSKRFSTSLYDGLLAHGVPSQDLIFDYYEGYDET